MGLVLWVLVGLFNTSNYQRQLKEITYLKFIYINKAKHWGADRSWFNFTNNKNYISLNTKPLISKLMFTTLLLITSRNLIALPAVQSQLLASYICEFLFFVNSCMYFHYNLHLLKCKCFLRPCSVYVFRFWVRSEE